MPAADTSVWERLWPYRTEILLTFCSIRAFQVLHNPPSNFASFPSSFHVAQDIAGEHAWASFVLIAAMTKLFGLIFMVIWRAPVGQRMSYALRSVGVGGSAIFWTLMSISGLIGNPDSLFAGLGLAAGISAWWLLIKGLNVSYHQT